MSNHNEVGEWSQEVIIKVKWSRYRPGVAQRVGRGIALLHLDHGTGTGWGVSSTPRPHFTPGKDPVPINRRLCRPQGRSGPTENLVPTGIRSRIVQPIFSHYTDWATRPTNSDDIHFKTKYKFMIQKLTMMPQIKEAFVGSKRKYKNLHYNSHSGSVLMSRL